MSEVIIIETDYEYNNLKRRLFPVIERLDSKRIKSGDRVLLKPNLLTVAPPEKAVTTHPVIVRVVAEYLIDAGARVQISDSPAIGGFKKILREGGYLDELRHLDVEAREFKETAEADIGEPFGMVEIARDVLEADHVINLPKLKTHGQMLLTLSVKNLFGCIVGLRKPQWHLRTGVDRIHFAELLFLIAKKVNPLFTIMDGVLAMEGDGPGKSGTPVKLNMILGSNDITALDIAVCRILGVSPERLLTNKVAITRGYKSEKVKIEGSSKRIKNFRFPQLGPLIFGPSVLHPFMRRHLIERPLVDVNKCLQCGQCWSYCPARAIEKASSAIEFDYERCIRCYCCVEVCPHGALSKEEPLAGKFIRVLLQRKGA